MVANDGEVHITHKTASPFSRWDIEELGKEAGFTLSQEVGFRRSDYPGYINRKGEGHGSKCDDTFPVGLCSTFMFAKLFSTYYWSDDLYFP